MYEYYEQMMCKEWGQVMTLEAIRFDLCLDLTYNSWDNTYSDFTWKNKDISESYIYCHG